MTKSSIKNINLFLLSFLFLSSLVTLVATPSYVQAADGDSKFIICAKGDKDDCTFDDLKKLVNIVIQFIIFEVSMPVAAIGIMYAGGLLVIKGSNPGDRTKAYGILKNIIYGLVLMLAAYIIIKAVVVGLVGNTPASGVGRSLLDLFKQ